MERSFSFNLQMEVVECRYLTEFRNFSLNYCLHRLGPLYGYVKTKQN